MLQKVKRDILPHNQAGQASQKHKTTTTRR